MSLEMTNKSYPWTWNFNRHSAGDQSTIMKLRSRSRTCDEKAIGWMHLWPFSKGEEARLMISIFECFYDKLSKSKYKIRIGNYELINFVVCGLPSNIFKLAPRDNVSLCFVISFYFKSHIEHRKYFVCMRYSVLKCQNRKLFLQ